MKLFFIMLLVVGCASKSNNQPYDLISEMWIRKINKNEVINLYGSGFTEFNGGIYYKHQGLSWPKFIFYFDAKGENIKQNSLLSRDELAQLKKNIACNWEIKEKTRKSAHVIDHLETGSCAKLNVYYKEDPQYGMYRVIHLVH